MITAGEIMSRDVVLVLPDTFGALRERRLAEVFNEIRAVVAAVEGRPVKVIVETAYLNDQEKRMVCRMAARAGAAYVKTSTGFAPMGATVADVALMRRTLGRRLGIVAAGGIRTYADAVALMGAGADLIGTSHTEAILAGVARRAPEFVTVPNIGTGGKLEWPCDFRIGPHS